MKSRPLGGTFEGVPWERWILRNFLKMRVHARPSFIVTINLPSFVTLIRCFIGRSKPLGRLEEFGQAVFHKEVKIQRSPGTPSEIFLEYITTVIVLYDKEGCFAIK
jgi:hypothetical protein